MIGCPTTEELEEFAIGAKEWNLDLSPRQWKPWQHIPMSRLADYLALREIALHLRECAECRERLAEVKKPLAALHVPLEVDPGPEFTDRILEKAVRPLADRMWFPRWPSFSRKLSWSVAGLALLVALLVWIWPDGIGDNKVTAALPPAVSANAPCAVPVLVSDRQGQPVPNSRVRITAAGMPAYRGKTDRYGVCRAMLTLPEKAEDDLRLNVEVENSSGRHEIALFTQLKDAQTLYLSSDKPLYQPGQTVRLRLLCLQRIATTPIAGKAITLTVNDPRGNLLWKKELKTSEWGVASADFPLDTEVEPGDYAIEAKAGEDTAGRTVTVSRYTLPKYKITLKTDKSWFLPGETIAGTLEARYLFGKPCAGAEAKIEGTTESGIGGESFAIISGTTDRDGKLPFKLRLPDYLAGGSAGGGSAVVTVSAVVTDAGGHLQDVSRDYPVSNEAILTAVLPESGAPVVGVENEFYVITSYPDGSPAPAKVTVTAPVQATITTDNQGIGSFKYKPASGRTWVELTARGAGGAAGSFYRALSSVGENRKFETDPNTGRQIYHAPDVLIRTDKPVYKAGEVARILVLAPGQQGAVYLEVTRDKQPVGTQAGVIEKGKAQFEMPLGGDVGGLLAINAYLPGAAMDDGDPYNGLLTLVARGSRTVLVRPADELKVTLEAPEDARPGEEQQATLQVTDKEGKGVSAAVGLAGVDEAVFALENQYPGMARMFFLLQQELDDPSIEAHFDDLPGHFRLDQAIPEAPTAARVAMAAYDMQPTLSMGEYNEQTADGRRYEARERQGNIALFVLLVGIWLLILITVLGTWRRRMYAIGGYPVGTVIGLLVYLGFLGYFAFLTYINGDGSLDGVIFFSCMGWGLLALHRIIPAGSSSWTVFTVSLASIAIIGTVFFPFTKAREKARSVSSPQVANLRALGYLNDSPASTTAIPKQETLMEKDIDGGPIDGVYRSSREPTTISSVDEQSTAPAAAVRVREYFPETLAWMPEIVTDGEGKADITLPAADSITTWRLSLLANAKDGRLGSADIPYQVFQDFFVDADVPVQLTVGDAFSLPVAVHNYAKERQTITLTLDARAGLKVGEKTTASLTLEPDGVGKALFPIHAVAAGRGQITVKAKGDKLADAVRRHIDVVPQGRRVEEAANAILRGDAVLKVNVPFGADPATSSLALRFFPGPVSQALAGLDGMLQQPYGCFEQTTSTTYPNLMILRYLKESGSKDAQTLARAQTFVMLGYQRLLTFEVEGGGFSLFGESPAEFALTGLGLAEFQDMAEVQAVDEKLLARTANWLAAHWNEADPVQRSFAALPLWRAGKKELAAAWIGKRGTESGLSTYELAVLANVAARMKHALAPVLANALANKVKNGDPGASWDSTAPRMTYESWMGNNSVETSALAVQAFGKAGIRADLVTKGVDFLTARRSPSGGWSGTQDTVQALRALLETSAAAQRGTVKVTVNGESVPDVKLTGDGAVKALKLNKYLRQGENTVSLRAANGCNPSCQLAASYYTTAPAPARGANPVTVTYDKTQLKTGDIAIATVKVAVPRPIDMAMVDLSVPPGFLPLREDLDTLKDAGQIARYDLTGTQVILYLRKLDGPATFRYRLRALFPVTATVRASTVYPYYQPETRYMSREGKIKVL